MEALQAKCFNYNLIEERPLSDLSEFKSNRRLKIFLEKGCKCVSCGKEGTKLMLGIAKDGGKHWDVYTEDLIPLTIDHIYPKSKGGSNEMSNLQPMCFICNNKKGNTIHENLPLKDDYPFIVKPKKIYPMQDETSFKPGDTIYSRTSYKLIGTIKSIKPNPKHPRQQLSATTFESEGSFYNLKKIFKI